MTLMKLFTRILLILTVFAALSPQISKAQSKKQLLINNRQMAERLDSIMQVLCEYEDKISSLEDSTGAGGGRSKLGISEDGFDAEMTDSLLAAWYTLGKDGELGSDEDYISETPELSSDTPDSVFLRRLEALNVPFPIAYNQTVRNYIILYAEKNPARLERLLGLSQYYFPFVEEVLRSYGLPLELKYMIVIESAFNPSATSKAGAKGMWQFMYTSGRNYGLKINSYVDERMDPYKATEAAAKYLRDSYNVFHDWNLAISSYNCGPGNVNKAIKRSGGKTDFWAIYPYLPRETRNYVPAFVGAMYAMNYPSVKPAQSTLPVHVDTFKIGKNLHFQQVSELTGISMEDLRTLNPSYYKDIVPGKEMECLLRVPYQYTAAFVEHEDSVYTYRIAELLPPATLEDVHKYGSGNNQARIVYVVKKGDYLGRIASKHHVSVSQLKAWNGLRSDNISIGQKLIIYPK